MTTTHARSLRKLPTAARCNLLARHTNCSFSVTLLQPIYRQVVIPKPNRRQGHCKEMGTLVIFCQKREAISPAFAVHIKSRRGRHRGWWDFVDGKDVRKHWD